jgi:hypothetical protein
VLSHFHFHSFFKAREYSRRQEAILFHCFLTSIKACLSGCSKLFSVLKVEKCVVFAVFRGGPVFRGRSNAREPLEYQGDVHCHTGCSDHARNGEEGTA